MELRDESGIHSTNTDQKKLQQINNVAVKSVHQTIQDIAIKFGLSMEVHFEGFEVGTGNTSHDRKIYCNIDH